MADDAEPKKEAEGKAYDTIERDFQEVSPPAAAGRVGRRQPCRCLSAAG